MSPSLKSRANFNILKEGLTDIYLTAVESVKPKALITKNVNLKNNDILSLGTKISGSELQTDINLKQSNIHILGIGKSAMSMTRSLIDRFSQLGLENKCRDGFLIAPSHLKDKKYDEDESIFRNSGINCYYAAENNLPDFSSIDATKKLFQFTRDRILEDEKEIMSSTFIVLIGGGGSACLSWPKYVDLAKKLEIIKFLQRNGANIIELNKVRKFFSCVKGGKFARKILNQGRRVEIITFILSDVIGNPIEFIASGPTCLFPQSNDDCVKNDMMTILNKYAYRDINGLISKIEQCEWDQECEVQEFQKDLIKNIIIGDNTIAIDEAKKKALERGFNVQIIGNSLQGSTESIIDTIIESYQKTSHDSPVLIIGGGEAIIQDSTSIVTNNWGLGGRCQEMALDYQLKGWRKNDNHDLGRKLDLFLAGTTDGQDGPTNVGGCFGSHFGWSEANFFTDDMESLALEAKRSHDSYNFWKSHKPDWLLETGLTETNVMDLYMLLIGDDNEIGPVEH